MSLAKDTLSDFDIGYLSGMLDADGSITVSLVKGKYLSVRIRFYNNNLDIIERLKSMIGEEYCSVYVNDRSGKVEYALSINNGGRIKLLSAMKLIMKEKRREIAIEILTAQANKDIERYSYLLDEWEREIGRSLKK